LFLPLYGGPDAFHASFAPESAVVLPLQGCHHAGGVYCDARVGIGEGSRYVTVTSQVFVHEAKRFIASESLGRKHAELSGDSFRWGYMGAINSAIGIWLTLVRKQPHVPLVILLTLFRLLMWLTLRATQNPRERAFSSLLSSRRT
jgi:hypothetical protein